MNSRSAGIPALAPSLVLLVAFLAWRLAATLVVAWLPSASTGVHCCRGWRRARKSCRCRWSGGLWILVDGMATTAIMHATELRLDGLATVLAANPHVPRGMDIAITIRLPEAEARIANVSASPIPT